MIKEIKFTDKAIKQINNLLSKKLAEEENIKISSYFIVGNLTAISTL